MELLKSSSRNLWQQEEVIACPLLGEICSPFLEVENIHDHFCLTVVKECILKYTVLFCSFIHLEAWIKVPNAYDTPASDLCLFNSIQGYKKKSCPKCLSGTELASMVSWQGAGGSSVPTPAPCHQLRGEKEHGILDDGHLQTFHKRDFPQPKV